MTVVIGTAGHIDHGKTTLLRALTGIDADRLPEERARGMTIDVGYAHLVLPDGTELDFVDVPGHDRLVGNMLVGAGEIDAALLVIAADDGPRAQTREHLELLDGLAISDGLLVVTKTDAVDATRVAAVIAEARALVASTTLRGVPIVAASTTTGDGIDAVARALEGLRDRVVAGYTGLDGAAPASRLAIDRVFTVRGRGTVVTGTLRGAPVERGALLRVVPGAADRRVRVREVQVHGRTVERGWPGRLALNVTGAGLADLSRGVVLTTDPGVVATNRLLVALRPVAAVGRDLASAAGGGHRSRAALTQSVPADRTPVVIHSGTAHVTGVVGRTGRDDADLGGERSAILRLERPIAAAPGDRFVIRRQSPAETLGGGRVLDPEPARGVARRRTTPDRLAALAAARAGSDAWRTARLDLHGALGGGSPSIAPDVALLIDDGLIAAVVSRSGIRTAELVRMGEIALRRAVGVIGHAGAAPARAPGPATAAATDLPRRLVTSRLDDLVAAARLVRDGDRIRPPGSAATGPSPALMAAMERLVEALSSAGPPALGAAAHEAGCPPEGIRLLEAAERIVRLDDDLAWAEPTWRELAWQALEMARREPLTPAAYRDVTGTSRKYVMALLEDLDRRAILRRTEAGHVPGQRAAQLGERVPAVGAGRADPAASGAARPLGAGR